jgi:hypothetical protein
LFRFKAGLFILSVWYQFTRLWNAGKDDVANTKLKVQFVWPDPNARKPATTTSSTAARGASSSSSGTENAESLRHRLAREDSANDNIPSNPDAVLAELLNLRKKYDAVVDYSAHLTAERDSIVTQFEDLQREYAREIGQKKTDSKTGKVERQIEKKSVQQVKVVNISRYRNFNNFVMLSTAGFLYAGRGCRVCC